MTALLADPTAAGPRPETPAPEGDSVPPPAPAAHECPHCGAPLEEGQQWCLRCGACPPDALQAGPDRRPLVVMAVLAAVLAAGAAVAGAAALTHKPPAHRVVLLSVAAAPRTTTPAVPTPGAATGTGAGGTSAAGGTSTARSHGNLLFPPASAAKPPKIPAATPTPSSSGSGAAEGGGSTNEAGSTGTSTTPAEKKTSTTGTSTTPSETKAKEGTGTGTGSQPTPIVLDTDAATTYNPSGYPASGFGDAALAIDGEPSTAWTAQVQPTSFPHMAEGLLIDARSPTRVGTVELATPTRGMVVQVYGAVGATAPTAITEPGWVMLSGSHTLKKQVTHLRLRAHGRSFRYVLVWVVKAPAASRGTAAAPGHVALSEVVLYQPASS